MPGCQTYPQGTLCSVGMPRWWKKPHKAHLGLIPGSDGSLCIVTALHEGWQHAQALGSIWGWPFIRISLINEPHARLSVGWICLQATHVYRELFAWQFISRERTETWRNRLPANFEVLWKGFPYPWLTVHGILEESKAGKSCVWDSGSPDTLFTW